MTLTTNLFADLPSHLPDELFTTLLDDINVRIERIVIVLKGAARL